MFTVTVRDRLMIAHSFTGEVFGRAHRLHGATYIVDVTFHGERLDRDDVLIDIGRAGQQLRQVLAALEYRNLDDEPAFQGRNSTTEVVAQEIADRLCKAIQAGDLGDFGPAHERLSGLTVTLHESDIAWASYERAP